MVYQTAFDGEFFSGLRDAIKGGAWRYPTPEMDPNLNFFIDLTDIDSRRIVAKDTVREDLALCISKQAIRPYYKRGKHKRALESARIDFKSGTRINRDYIRRMEKELQTIRDEFEETSEAELEDEETFAGNESRTFDSIYDEYIAMPDFQSLRKAHEISQAIKRYFLEARVANRRIGDLKPNQFGKTKTAAWLRGLKAKHGQATVKQARAVVHKMFEDLIAEMVLRNNPIKQSKGVDAPPPRTSKLNRDQVKELWNACEKLNDTERDLVRFMMLTAQRRTQASLLRWDWIHWQNNVITFPREVMKGREKYAVAFDMPMSPPVRELLESRKYHYGDNLLVFAAQGSGRLPIDNFNRLACKIDHYILGREYHWKTEQRLQDCFPWIFHDFRRTAVALVQEADELITPMHAKLLLAQKMAVSKEMQAYWSQEKEMKLKRRLFDLLGDEIMKCVD